MQLFLKENFFKNYKLFSKKNVLRFLSLRYGAEFRRSRLVVSQGSGENSNQTVTNEIVETEKAAETEVSEESSNVKGWNRGQIP